MPLGGTTGPVMMYSMCVEGFVEVRHVDMQHIVIPSIVRGRWKFFRRIQLSWEIIC